MASIEPTVIIDGAIPREPWERVQKLLDYATDISAATNQLSTDPRFYEYENDMNQHHGDMDYDWNELEDDIVHLIEDMLPDNMCVEMGLHTPGDVIVTIPNGNGQEDA